MASTPSDSLSTTPCWIVPRAGSDPAKPAELISLYERILVGIRAEDSEHLVFIEGDGLSREFDLFDRRLDDNMAYSPHVYLWVGSPDVKWLASFADLSSCHDAPVWVGEFGEDRLTDIEDLRIGFEDLSGWAIWTWKKVDEGGTPGVTLIDAPEDWTELITSLNQPPGTAQVKDEEAAFAALDAFLTAAQDTRENPEMFEALGL